MILSYLYIIERQMDNAPIKKKKKYVLMKPQSNGSQSSSRISQRQPVPPTLSRCRFDYSFQQIVNHIFAKLLPDNRFTIKLSQKLIFGREKELDDFIDELDENVRYYSGVVLELQEQNEREDIQYEIQEKHKAKLFGYKLIEKCIAQFFAETKYQLQCTAFLKLFQSEDHERLFLRITTQYLQEFLQKIQQKAHPIRSNSVSDKPTVRGNRKQLRIEIQSATIDGKEFDPKAFKDFVHKSQKLDRKDIEIIQNKNAYNYVETYTVKLLCHEGEQGRKKEAFNYYFRQQNFISLPLKASQHKIDIISKYDKFKTNWLQIRVIKGYKSSKWDEKTLLYKLRCGQVANRKSNYTNEPFEALHLIGLLPKVRQYLQILEDEINNVPMDDVKQELFIQLDEEVKDIMKGDAKIEKFIQNFIKDYTSKLSSVCEVTMIKFPVRGIKLNILIKPGKQQQYKKSTRIQLQNTMMKDIAIRKFQLDFIVDSQFLERLSREEVLVVKKQDKVVYYLQTNDRIQETLEKVQKVQTDFQSNEQEEISVKGKSKLTKYLQIIKKIKDSHEQYKQIYVTQPQTIDRINFRINFIGPRKKNSIFTETIKKKIQEYEATLGSYYDTIQEDVAKFLVQDNIIQKQIQQKYKISIVIDPTIQIQALLQIEPLILNKNIKIIKCKSLSRVPFGSSIYFCGRWQLQRFEEKYLDVLKLKAKRLKKDELIQQAYQPRKFSLFYKEKINPIQILSRALKEQCDESACLIMPQTEKQKQKFIQDVLTNLTSNLDYQRKKYSITIIDTDMQADIQKIIGLPQFSTLKSKQQTVVEWSCEGRPYTKSGNDKINDAIANGSNKCLIESDDVVRRYGGRSHLCDLQRNILTNLKTSEQIKLVKDNSGFLTFRYKNYDFKFTSKQENLVKYYNMSSMSKFYMSLVYYQLDLTNMTQENIFTRKKRKLQRTQKVIVQTEDKVHAFYDVNSPQIIFSFDFADERMLQPVIERVSDYVQSKRIKETIVLQPISSRYRGRLQELIRAKAQDINMDFKCNLDKNQVLALSLNQKDVEQFKNMVQSEVDYLLNCERMEEQAAKIKKQIIAYPPQWEPQTSDIQNFTVNPHSQQFRDVQARFTVCPIYSLQRIQNKYLYGKYTSELDHLAFLNGNIKPKEMMLFHGTKDLDPQIIWSDKQQGFNINYSSDTNLLGMGIYFAEKAQYSYGYKFKDPYTGLKSMFLSKVIVGDSQLMNMTRLNAGVKDTNIKDKTKGLKYESMLGKHQVCDIYVVYKDKRAYPAYLIKFK